MHSGIHRRTILKLAAIFGLHLFGWQIPASGRTVNSDLSLSLQLQRNLARLFPEQKSAREVGRLYLGLYPVAARGAIDRAQSLLGQSDFDSRALTHTLSRLRADEFSRGESIIIDGWVLARCEADLCAAAALLADDY